MGAFLEVQGILERTLDSAARRLAESRNRVPAIPYSGPYGGRGWTR